MSAKLKTVIADDSRSFLKAFEILLNKHKEISVVGTALSILELRETLKNEEIDLLFLDIMFPEDSGFDFLTEGNVAPQVVLVSSNKDFAIEAFNYDVTDFLLKPITPKRMAFSINKVLERRNKASHKIITQANGPSNIFIKSDGKLVNIDVSTITFIESKGDYVKFSLSDGKHYVVYSTLKNIEKKLEHILTRVHKSFLVNRNYITSIDKEYVYIDKQVVSIGAKYKDNLLDSLDIL